MRSSCEIEDYDFVETQLASCVGYSPIARITACVSVLNKDICIYIGKMKQTLELKDRPIFFFQSKLSFASCVRYFDRACYGVCVPS